LAKEKRLSQLANVDGRATGPRRQRVGGGGMMREHGALVLHLFQVGNQTGVPLGLHLVVRIKLKKILLALESGKQSQKPSNTAPPHHGPSHRVLAMCRTTITPRVSLAGMRSIRTWLARHCAAPARLQYSRKQSGSSASFCCTTPTVMSSGREALKNTQPFLCHHNRSKERHLLTCANSSTSVCGQRLSR